MTDSKSPEAPAEVRLDLNPPPRPFQEVMYRWHLPTLAEREASRKAWAEAYDKMTPEQHKALNERFIMLVLPRLSIR